MDNEIKTKLDFLAKDEEEAISGYDKVIAQVGDMPIVEQLKKIRDEEIAHLDFLRKAKDNFDLEYVDPNEEKEASRLFGMNLGGK